MRRCALICFFALAGSTRAQPAEFGGHPAVVLSNGKLELTVALTGATLANLALLDDPNRLSPLWNEAQAVRMAGGTTAAADVFGHFLCLDGFGAPSQEETKAHYPFHGEARGHHFEVLMSTKVPPISVTLFGAQLPLAQELVTRKVQMVDGENVAYIETQVENLLAFDRPISWAEHATLGPPFLEPGKVTIDMPAARCRVRAEKPELGPGRLEPLKDFDWPMAPLRKGGSVSLLDVPEDASVDLASCQIRTDRVYGYVTAFRQDKRLLFGYVFRRQDFPWLMNWMNYTGNEKAARGIEFSTQPFDVSRREAVDAHEMFGTPTYRWLPAKSKIITRFLLFYTKVPDNFDVVADVVLENKLLKIRSKAGQAIVLKALLPL
jgi:hypothetical protein